MAVKKENKIVPITLTKYHQKKLAVLRNRTGLTSTQIFQRLLEGHDVFGEGMDLEGKK